MQYLQVSLAFCNSKWLCVRKYIPVKYHGITTCNHILKLKCTISFFMWCIKLHTSAFATRRGNSMIVSYFLTPQVFKTIFIPSCYCCCCFWKKCIYGLKALRFFTASLYAFHGFGYMGLQEIKRDGYNQTNVTTWVQIVVVVAVHLAINFIHKGRHQQKKTKYEYLKKSFAESTN